MKKLSIKLKITLWFAAFMVLLCAAAFAFVALLSSSDTNRDLERSLTGFVDSNARAVRTEGGKVTANDDFITFRNGIYCILYDGSGEIVEGKAPYSELEEIELSEGGIRSEMVEGEEYLIYDLKIPDRDRSDVWLRGVTLANPNGLSRSAMLHAACIALPLLLALAVVGGYLIARRSLKPIQQISRTAELIGESGDLTRRIELSGSGDELHQLAAVFNRMFDRLEKNFEAERSFTSDASHELRTPVTVILAQCEYALEDAKDEQELYEALGVVQKQGYRMKRMIESLLQFTRLEQQTEAFQPHPINLSALVEKVSRETSETGSKGIALHTDIAQNISVEGDEATLSRMLENLIRNAYKYGRENGNINVALKAENGKALLSVADDGIGISAEDMPRIWNRFYRADKARSAGGEGGFGLGLAIVKQIAVLHGGSVEARSEPDKGSVFTVSLPLKKDV